MLAYTVAIVRVHGKPTTTPYSWIAGKERGNKPVCRVRGFPVHHVEESSEREEERRWMWRRVRIESTVMTEGENRKGGSERERKMEKSLEEVNKVNMSRPQRESPLKSALRAR